MNGLELKKKLESMTEEELKNIVVQALWDVEHVDTRLDVIKDDYDTSGITLDEKREILEKAMDEAGGDSALDIWEAIDGYIMLSPHCQPKR